MPVSIRKWKDASGQTKTSYQVYVCVTKPDGTRFEVRKKAPQQTAKGAKEFERQLLNAIMDGSYGKEAPKEVPTFAAFAQEHFLPHSKARNKFSHYETNVYMLEQHLSPAFGAMKLDAITKLEVDKYVAKKLGSGLSKKTVQNQLTLLRHMLTLAVEWAFIAKAPKVEYLKVPPKEIDHLDFDEADRLLSKAEGQWRVMWLVAMRTGLRIGELTGLRWSDVDLHTGRLLIRQSIWKKGHIEDSTKNGEHGVADLSDETLAALKAHRHLRGEYVFCNDDGTALSRGKCEWHLFKAIRLAGIAKHVTPHVLRHTFISHLMARGVPIVAVQHKARHKDIKMTLRYAHLSPRVERDAVNLLDQPAPTLTAPAKQEQQR